MTAAASYIPVFLLALARASGFFAIAPIYSEQAVPRRLRYFLGVVVALAVAGRMAPMAAPASLLGFAGILLVEAMIGAGIGYAAKLIFAGVEMGASYVGQQMGVSLVAAYDPSGETGSEAVSTLFRLTAIVIFLAIGGHRQLIGAMLTTFQLVPPALAGHEQTLVATVVSLLAGSFFLALKVAAPVLIALLLATAALGMLQKSIPQVNILSTTMPVRVLLGLVVLAGSLAILGPLVDAAWTLTQKGIADCAK
jgi:flagellar biosynthetic protein FliR